MSNPSVTERYLKETPVSPVFCTSVMIQNWGTNKSGAFGRLKFIDSTLSNMANPFKGCSTFRSNPQRLYIAVIGRGDTPEDVLYSGEATLKNWGDGPKGSWFEVHFANGPENRDWNPLAGTEAHNTTGEHVTAVVWFLNDHEERVASVARKPVFSYSQTSPVKQSQVKCRQDVGFQRWCHKFAKRMGYQIKPGLDDPSYAAEVVRLYMGVESRSVMSEDTQAGQQAREKWREIEGMYVEENYYGIEA